MHLPNPFHLITRNRYLNSGTSNFMIVDGGKLITTESVDPQQAMKNSDVFAVINRISSDIAACSFSSQQYSHLLKDPFKLMNPYSGWQEIMVQLLLYGNSYVVMHLNSKTNQVDSLEPVPSDNVQLELTTNAQDIIYHVTYNDERERKDYTSEQMLHFKLVTPGMSDKQYVGVSPLMSLLPELGIQDKSHKLMLASLAHAIAPTSLYETPNALTEPGAKDKIREQFEKANTGNNAGRIMVMDAGAKLSTIDVTPNIDKLLQNAQFSQTQIAKAFGIPDSYLNGQGDQQSSIEMIRSIYQNALTMYIRPLESELTYKLGTPVKLNLSDTIDVDGQQLVDNVQNLVKNNVLTPRQALGLLIAKDVMPGLTVTDDDLAQLNQAQAKGTTKGGENNAEDENENGA